MTEPPDDLLLRRSEPEARAVLEDWLESHGRNLRWLGGLSTATTDTAYAADAAAADAATDTAYADAAAADAYADADDYADADADAATTDTAYAADAAADADADTAYAATADPRATRNTNRWMQGEPNVKQGLAIVVTPGSYWALTQVGWLRRVAGDEWELVGARTLRRRSGQRVFAEVAKDGPLDDNEVKPASEFPEPIHRLTIRRVVYCGDDNKAWLAHCPKPKGWVES